MSVFTKEGKFLSSSILVAKEVMASLNFLCGVAFDCDGILCICDQANSRVQFFCEAITILCYIQ